jgi:hypothetical protein
MQTLRRVLDEASMPARVDLIGWSTLQALPRPAPQEQPQPWWRRWMRW